MGYYTSHRLETSAKNAEEEMSVIKAFREACEGARYAISDEGYAEEPCKWYNSSDDLIEFSKSHPEVLFTLSGEGEEAGDLWKLYVKNGKSQMARAELIYPEFDESKFT